ncbi:DUF397 domain-containing protein [Streptomyces sp. ISL-98]|uniref:DUF397 domain-containing protein n=1 Tax=Streptomyces sp. ISL-98 TaxID=2819192 RepID=UPI001BE512A0|nr:DUF397 domain-containing protein [Streptomyces sp. ISL-98]MBT2506927.1 DUF397 domain-containing protein [Streptomyces sp. ISL-98]
MDPISRKWRKSSYSGADDGCVEILTPPPAGKAPIRDSKVPQGHVIMFPDTAWISFVDAVQRDELADHAP